MKLWRMTSASMLGLLLAALLAACGTTETSTPAAQPTAATVAEPPTAMADQPTAAPEATAASADAQPTAASADTGGGDDLLAQVKQSGKLRISTDANYKPQSYKNPDNTWEGFDIDVAREIAKRLGVEPEFLDINFDVITAGSWNDRWDINVGSITVTEERMNALLFTTPYYYTPASFAVHTDSAIASIEELAGKQVGLGTATTYQSYLQGDLKLAGEEILIPPPQVSVKIYDTDQLALTDLALGDGTRLDAVLTALPTIQDSINGGQPFKVLGDPVYYEDLAVALDQKSSKPAESLQAEISKIIEEMRKDGTLTTLSNKYYGVDLTTKK